jgi:hypothetical protein
MTALKTSDLFSQIKHFILTERRYRKVLRITGIRHVEKVARKYLKRLRKAQIEEGNADLVFVVNFLSSLEIEKALFKKLLLTKGCTEQIVELGIDTFEKISCSFVSEISNSM